MKTAEDILNVKGSEIICVEENTVVCEALKVMLSHQIASVLVKREKSIVGIWTERDLVKNCVVEAFDPKESLVGDYMETKLLFAQHDETPYQLMDKMLGQRMRHLLIKKGDEFVGILSAGDVVRACMHEKDDQLKAMNEMVSWEYYENWKWDRRKMPPIIHNREGLRVDTNPV
jgi:CBS domain-containing protein